MKPMYSTREMNSQKRTLDLRRGHLAKAIAGATEAAQVEAWVVAENELKFAAHWLHECAEAAERLQDMWNANQTVGPVKS
jgi:hypothetical protein